MFDDTQLNRNIQNSEPVWIVYSIQEIPPGKIHIYINYLKRTFYTFQSAIILNFYCGGSSSLLSSFAQRKILQKRFCWRHHVALKEKLSPPLEHQPLKKEQVACLFTHFLVPRKCNRILKLYSILSTRNTSVDAVILLISKISFLWINNMNVRVIFYA